jgi:hypothetical protein
MLRRRSPREQVQVVEVGRLDRVVDRTLARDQTTAAALHP